MVVAAVLAVWAAGCRPSPASEDTVPTATARHKPALALLTSLPLMFGERFGLEAPASPLLAKLTTSFDVQVVSLADKQSLAPYNLLLMAHPRAQPAEALVDLDQWVRNGGRALLLADPRLDWHSDRALGDKLRPPPDFADTGLLAHWGLALNGPVVEGPATRTVEGLAVLASSPGALVATAKSCSTDGEGFIARCKVGTGLVTVIADADFINVGGADSIDGPTAHNLELVSHELARLAR